MSVRPSNLFLTGLVGVSFLGASSHALLAQLAINGISGGLSKTETFSGGFKGQNLAYVDKKGKAAKPGKPINELLRGNGTAAGYMLSNGGIIPDSIRVTVGARTLKQGDDYYVDFSGGSLFFTTPVRRGDSIRVYYRYVEGQDANRSPVSLPGLNFGGKDANLGLNFGLSRNTDGLDYSTYGFNMNSKMGNGSVYNGLFYYSSVAQNNHNVAGEAKATDTRAASKAEKVKGANGMLIDQAVNVKAGAAKFRVNYTDVDKNFGGFGALKMNGGSNPDMLAKVNMLEKEKGVKRLGFGAGLDTSKSSGLSVDFDKISDGSGDIVRQSLGFKSTGLTLNYTEQEVGSKFTRFQGLREADAAQWGREKGVKRSGFGANYSLGKSGNLFFNDSRIGDKSGSLQRDSFGFAGKSFSVSSMSRRADAKFSRIADLSDADKGQLALEIRRQFNPNAVIGEVTPQERAQSGLEAGLTRNQSLFTLGLGKQSNLLFNQFNIGDGKGKVQRNSLSLTSRNFTLNYMDQAIDPKFGRLGTLNDFEKSQLGNEAGIRRTALGGSLALNKRTGLTFSDLNIGDAKGSYNRQDVGLTTTGFNAKLQLADTDKSFNRVGDLAALTPAERAALELDRGFKRTDLTANLTSVKGLGLEVFNSSATNAGDKQDRNVYRYFGSLIPNKNGKVTYLTEGNVFSKDGKAFTSSTRDLLTADYAFGKAAKFALTSSHQDAVVGGKAAPTIANDFLHFETDRTKANNLTLEHRNITLSDGKFEKTTQIDGSYKLASNMSAKYNRLSIDRGADPSATTNSYQWNWLLKKGLTFSGNFSETGTNNKQDATARGFGLAGQPTKNLNVAATYSKVTIHGGNTKSVSDVAISNAKPTRLLLMKDATVTMKYAHVNDQNKRQNEGVQGSLKGNIGKNALAMDYNGAFDPKGQRNIARAINFVSDRDPKQPIQFDVLYKSRNVNRGDTRLVRKYNVAMKMGGTSALTYSYNSLPEDAQGNMQPTKSSAFALKQSIADGMNLTFDYATASNLTQKVDSSRISALLNGKLDRLSTLELGYIVDLGPEVNNRFDSTTLRFALDRQVNSDDFFTISTTYTIFRRTRPDELTANLDFKIRF